MSKFNQLKQYDIQPEKSVRYDLVDIQMNDHTPYLMVKPATEGNKPFARAQLQRSNKRVRAAGARGVTLENLAANRDDDRELYPRFIITGWGNVFDVDQKEVPFSVKDCVDFLEELPDWIFDKVRLFCVEPGNFAETVDREDLGNSS